MMDSTNMPDVCCHMTGGGTSVKMKLKKGVVLFKAVLQTYLNIIGLTVRGYLLPVSLAMPFCIKS